MIKTNEIVKNKDNKPNMFEFLLIVIEASNRPLKVPLSYIYTPPNTKCKQNGAAAMVVHLNHRFDEGLCFAGDGSNAASAGPQGSQGLVIC